LAAENPGQHLCLAVVSTFIDEDPTGSFGFACPEIAFPPSHPNEAQTIEIDLAIVAMRDVPEQDRFAEAVIGGLRERAGARYGATAIVEPVTRDAPSGRIGHERLHWNRRQTCHRQT
jgi:hypothetical protein